MKILNIFRSKDKKKEKFILDEFEKGRILQVDNNIDNKEFLREK